MAQETRTHRLDHENDRYVECEPMRINSVQKVQHDLVMYISELGKIYQSNDAYNCSVSMWAETKDKWYTTRRDRLLQLIAALEIGLDEFVENSRAEVEYMRLPSYHRIVSPDHVEESIERFLSGMDSKKDA